MDHRIAQAMDMAGPPSRGRKDQHSTSEHLRVEDIWKAWKYTYQWGCFGDWTEDSPRLYEAFAADTHIT